MKRSRVPAQHKNKESGAGGLHKNEKLHIDIWHNIKCSSIHIIGVSKDKENELEAEKIE